MTIFHHELLTKRGLAKWMNASIIHANICSLIQKKCHMKSYYNDIKYHMTLNMIFSVVPESGRVWVASVSES